MVFCYGKDSKHTFGGILTRLPLQKDLAAKSWDLPFRALDCNYLASSQVSKKDNDMNIVMGQPQK